MSEERFPWRIYHNPAFALYTGDHNDIVIPTEPVAFVRNSTTKPLPLSWLYHISQHRDCPWYQHDDVMLRIRSTSAGDLLRAPDGTFFVVERAGFNKLQRDGGQFTGRDLLVEAIFALEDRRDYHGARHLMHQAYNKLREEDEPEMELNLGCLREWLENIVELALDGRIKKSRFSAITRLDQIRDIAEQIEEELLTPVFGAPTEEPANE